MNDIDINQCLVRAIDTLSLVGITIEKVTFDYKFKEHVWRQTFKKYEPKINKKRADKK